MNTEFQGKTLVISGGTRGIGKAIVYEFAKVGANIAFTYNLLRKLLMKWFKIWRKIIKSKLELMSLIS